MSLLLARAGSMAQYRVAGGAATVSDYKQSTWSGVGLSEATASLSWSAGDLIVVLGATANTANTLSLPTATGLTFTQQALATAAVNTRVYLWTATAASSGSSVISSTITGSSTAAGLSAWAFTGSGGIGTPVTFVSQSALTQSLTRVQSNSRVITAWAEWNAINDTTITTVPVGATQRVAQFVSSETTFFVLEWGNQGAAGTTSYGIANFTGTPKFSGILVEIKGTAGVAVAPSNSITPVITTDGTPQTGEIITCSTGTWSGDPTITYAYQWKRGGVDISGATSSSYTLGALDVGASVLCAVTATNSAGNASVNSNTIIPSAGAATNYPAVVIADSPYRYWRMGQASGTEPDEMGSGGALTLTGSVTRNVIGGVTARDDDGAVTFTSGAGQATLDLSSTNNITIEMGIWWNAYAGDDALLCEFTSNWNVNGGSFIVDPNNSTGGAEANTVSLGFSGASDAAFRRRWTFPRSALSAAAWHHLVIVFSATELWTVGDPGNCRVYVDGVAVTLTQRESNAIIGMFANSTFNLMSRNAASLNAAGRVDELAIYRTALSSTQVAAHFASFASFPRTSLLDDFNRASLTGWTNSVFPADPALNIFSNTELQNSAGVGWASAWYQGGPYGADQEVYATVTNRATSVELLARLNAPGTSGVDGYLLDVSAAGVWSIYKIINNVQTQVGSNVTGHVLATSGDKVGFELVGPILKGYKYTSGAWTQVISVSDSSVTAGGYIGAALQTTSRLDNFGGGTIT